MPSSAPHGHLPVLERLRAVGAGGATPQELATATGLSKSQVCTHLRFLGRHRLARKDGLRPSPNHLEKRNHVWVASEAS
jgi:DNA-binding IclR family transcriptional regulator